MAALFVYGTLMCEDIFEQVAGSSPRAQKATLKDFRRFAIKNEHYPGVINQQGSQVEGLVYDDVSERSWALLDRFEGDMYSRQEVNVHLDNGNTMDAFVYVVKPEYTHLMENSDWSYDRFLTTLKTQFITGYPGFHNLDRKE